MTNKAAQELGRRRAAKAGHAGMAEAGRKGAAVRWAGHVAKRPASGRKKKSVTVAEKP
jgi:hypothetical protein